MTVDRKLDLIGVPYTSMARPGGIADAIRVLREAGLAEHLDVRDAGDLDLIEGDAVRGASGLLKERALAQMVEATGKAIGTPAMSLSGALAGLHGAAAGSAPAASTADCSKQS